MDKITKEQLNDAKKVFEEMKGEGFSQEKADTVLNNKGAILEKSKKGMLSDLWEDIKTMMDMVGGWTSGEYKGVPVATMASVVAALFYVFLPIDVIPDFIPVLGLADDAAVVGLCLKAVKHDLDKFRNWKKGKAR